MARTGPPPKPDAIRRGQSDDKPILVLLPGGASETEVVVPPPPTGLLRNTRLIWFKYFESIVAGAFEEAADLPLLLRWITYVDEWTRITDTLRKEDRVVIGSQGQPVLNPLISYVKTLEGSIAKAEKELGLTPLSRAHLGLTAAEGKLTVEKINEAIRKSSQQPLVLVAGQPVDDTDDIVDAEFYEEADATV